MAFVGRKTIFIQNRHDSCMDNYSEGERLGSTPKHSKEK